LATERERELHNLLKLYDQKFFVRQLLTRKSKTYIFAKMFRTYSIGIVWLRGNGI